MRQAQCRLIDIRSQNVRTIERIEGVAVQQRCHRIRKRAIERSLLIRTQLYLSILLGRFNTFIVSEMVQDLVVAVIVIGLDEIYRRIRNLHNGSRSVRVIERRNRLAALQRHYVFLATGLRPRETQD